MAWFKKKRNDVIDLTYLAKRGLIKPKEEFREILPQQSTNSSSDSGSALGFLGALASSSETSEKPALGINKNKIEDIEYKLEIVSKRVNAMLDRLDLVEKKVSRDLRQSPS
jgi:hypothetical protein